MLSDIDDDQGQKTLKEFREQYGASNVNFERCDVTEKEDFDNLFSKVKQSFGNIDIMCNNAGIIHEKNWEKMIDINLIAMMRGTNLALKNMAKSKGGNGGVIINLSSAAGLKPVPFSPGYCAAKFGILGFSRSLALHPNFLEHCVRINCLCPFYTDTDMIKMEDDQLLGIEIAKAALQLTGVVKVQDVVAAFTELWQNEQLNGAVIEVNTKRTKLMTFPDTGFEFLTRKS